MKLIFLRHGEYNRIQTNPNDGPLTENGERQANAAGQWLRDLPLRPTHLIHTPTTRTAQTAKIALAALHIDADAILLETRRLPKDFQRWVDFANERQARLDDSAVVLAVGHQYTQALMCKDFGLPEHLKKKDYRAVIAVLEGGPDNWRCVAHFPGFLPTDPVG